MPPALPASSVMDFVAAYDVMGHYSAVQTQANGGVCGAGPDLDLEPYTGVATSATCIPVNLSQAYWISLNINENTGVSTYWVYTLWGSLVGTKSVAMVTGNDIQYFILGNNETGTTTGNDFFQNIMVDQTGSAPLLPFVPASFTAATCGQPDVDAEINGPTNYAINGDTINVPAGTCTWTTDEVITGAGITVQGAGTPNLGSGTFGAGTMTTTINDNAGTSTPVFYETGQTYGETSTLQNFNILPLTTSTALQIPIWAIGTCSASGCPNLRVDNINLGLGATVWNDGGGGTGSNAATGIAVDDFFGVADHNTIPTGSQMRLVDVHFSAWAGTGQYGDNSWAAADTFGTAQAFFAENNTFYGTITPLTDTESAPGGSLIYRGGGRIVARYNHITFTGNGTAGATTTVLTGGRARGGRQLECYDNTITCSSGNCQSTMGLRSGPGISYANVNSVSGGNFVQYINLYAVRRAAGYSPWGFGDGTGCYDDNAGGTCPGTVSVSGTATGGSATTLVDTGKTWTVNQWQSSSPYGVHDITQSCGSEILSNTATTLTIIQTTSQTCTPVASDSYEIIQVPVLIDQPGYGIGNYISGTTPATGWVSEALDPIYEWNDTTSAGSTVSDIVSNQGDLGMIANRDFYAQSTGIQTNATTPFNGTSGTGWGTLANRPTTCTTGVGYAEYTGGTTFVQFDECTSTNTWTSAVYTSYTYPHPLDSGSGTPIPAPAATMFVRAATFLPDVVN